MANCTVCGAKAGFLMSMCPACIAAAQNASAANVAAAQSAGTEQPILGQAVGMRVHAAGVERSGGGSESACIAIGIALLLIGGFFLLNPAESGAEAFSRDVVNLQRLYIGQTASICGAIFLAAGIRPRARQLMAPPDELDLGVKRAMQHRITDDA